MIVTTTPSVEGKTIAKYLRLVHGYSDNSREEALNQMKEMATSYEADAIVGVQISVLPHGNGTPGYHLCGTAVKFN